MKTHSASTATGPRTAEGKRIVSRNALKHGLTSRDVLLPEEDAPAFDRLRLSLLDEWRPVGGTEETLVERIAAAHWRQMRLWRREVGVYKNARYQLENPQASVGICTLYDAQEEKCFDRLNRCEATLNREYHGSLRQLLLLQDLRRKGLRLVDVVPAEAAPALQPTPSSAGTSGEITKQTPAPAGVPGSAQAAHVPATTPAQPETARAASHGEVPPPATLSSGGTSGETAKQTPGGARPPERAAA